MQQKIILKLLLNKREYDTLMRCIDYFKYSSNFFNDGESNVNAEDLRINILDNTVVEN